MAKTVDEIMNHELFSLRPDDSCEDGLGYILALGVTGAPVIDPEGRPIGVVSFRDLVARKSPEPVKERMTRPAIVVRTDASIEDAAKLLAESGVHRVVAVDAEGRAVGVVSSLDVIRGLIGLPAGHPATFPHFDPATGIAWSDDTLLEIDRLAVAPDGPGVFALVRGGRGVSEAVIWAEAAHNVRTRLYDILSLPQTDTPLLKRILSDYQDLRFRTASISDMQTRMKVLESLLAEAHKKLETAALA